MANQQVERDRRRHIQTCRGHRQMAVERLKVMKYRARYDRDPDLLRAIEDCENFIALIDADLAKAGHVLH
jgi:hypothetical protein